MIKSMLFQLLG